MCLSELLKRKGQSSQQREKDEIVIQDIGADLLRIALIIIEIETITIVVERIVNQNISRVRYTIQSIGIELPIEIGRLDDRDLALDLSEQIIEP